MSDNVLLTSLWLVPLIGMVTVLLVPKSGRVRLVKWVALGFTSATFILTLDGTLGGLPRSRASRISR